MSRKQETGNVSGLHWFKSSYSGSDGGDCVEVAAVRDAVFVRDSKVAGRGPALRVGRVQWAAFMSLAQRNAAEPS
ncbi:DUF397 domain-containing protein [Streptomyces sp. NPDC086838]|uniref:DUF397 domain-containing protein n=1 Tax=Streptomyces sp. NPDC086838 TaxID=3365762 RepID=UPI00382DA7C2